MSTGERGAEKPRISSTVPWCSGLAYVPVKDEIAGSNPVGTASHRSVIFSTWSTIQWIVSSITLAPLGSLCVS